MNETLYVQAAIEIEYIRRLRKDDVSIDTLMITDEKTSVTYAKYVLNK